MARSHAPHEAHESMRRLLHYAMNATKGTRGEVRGYADIGVDLDASAGTLTNWKSRGISKDGALEAERKYGCSAVWVLDGVGPEQTSGAIDFAAAARSRSASTDHPMVALGAKLLAMDAMSRKMAQPLLEELCARPAQARGLAARFDRLLGEPDHGNQAGQAQM